MTCLARLLAGSAIALSAVSAHAPPSSAQMRPANMQFSLAPMLEKVIPAVVSVRVAGERYRPIEIKPVSDEQRGADIPPDVPKEPFKAGGSGVIVKPKQGLIVTNNHVVADAKTIMVALADGRVFDARLVGRDVGTDVALLKIDAKDLPSVPIGDSDRLRVGDIVVAIGNPFGLESTATMGIVSALMRSDIGYEIFEDFVQIDATINPGNSGGALVNLKGELVAINTAVAGGGRNIGIGFAIPVNLARNVGEQLFKYGTVRRGGLGMLTENLTADVSMALQLHTSRGALVTRVLPGSPADVAGVKAGDVVVRVAGRPVRGSDDYVTRVVNTPLNTYLDVEVISDGQPKRFSLVVTELSPPQQEVPVPPALNGLGGAVLAPILLGSPHYGELQGAQVLRVEPKSQAYETGLERGDVIVAVEGAAVRSPEDVLRFAGAQMDSYRLKIVRHRVPALLRVQR
jgi:serine protease Do/serine protease DegQ